MAYFYGENDKKKISSFSFAANSFNSEIWDSNPAFFINAFYNLGIQTYIYY